jgi:L-seryl-tRNA(Ser) seleniumtransferase
MCVRGEYEVSLEEVSKIAQKYNLPVIADFAAEAYRKTHFKMALDKGADLVIFSGGKQVRGPNDTGLILGRKDLIEAVRQNSNPHYRIIIGRGYKVSREQIVGLVVALKKRLELDEEAEFKRDMDLCNYIAGHFEDFPHVEPRVYVQDDEIEGIPGVEFPIVQLKLDEEKLGMKAGEVAPLMWPGDPPIYLAKYFAHWGYVDIVPHSMKDGEADIVIDRLKQILSRNLENTP